MNDLISRQAALEKIHWLGLDNDTTIKCDLAIRALSPVNTQEPKTSNSENPSEDAISRQAVEEIINDIRDCISVEGYWAIFERMKKLPPANSQEPKTGHWIFHTDASGNSWHTCPACGHIAYTLTRFCPDCGARLEAPS